MRTLPITAVEANGANDRALDQALTESAQSALWPGTKMPGHPRPSLQFGSGPPGVVARTHLDELTGPLGIYQHARGRVPDLGQGYCTDDVARAAIVDILHGDARGRQAVADSLARSLQFLVDAFVPTTGRFRNFRDADGNWLAPHARGRRPTRPRSSTRMRRTGDGPALRERAAR